MPLVAISILFVVDYAEFYQSLHLRESSGAGLLERNSLAMPSEAPKRVSNVRPFAVKYSGRAG